MKLILPHEKNQREFGAKLAKACQDKSCIIFLQGNLGAGKTTLVRGFLNALGCVDKIKSPSYSLVEIYDFDIKNLNIYHLDLYRIINPQEVLNLGLFESTCAEKIIYLIEWPENAAAELPPPDITCSITFFETGRLCHILAHTPRGEEIMQAL